MDVGDGLKPGEAGIVNVMGFIVQHHEFIDLAHDLAEIDLGIEQGACGAGAKEIIPTVVVVGRGDGVVAGVDAVDIGEEEIACGLHHVHIVLEVHRELEVVAPGAACVAIGG